MCLWLVYRTIEKHGMTLKMSTDACADTADAVIYAEHVQVYTG